MKTKEAIQKIDGDALFELCEQYDNEEGVYPEHPYEGDAIYRFFRRLCAEEAEKKSGFVNYILQNGTSGSLREMFYNYFIAHLGILSEDDSACEEEIKEGMSQFFFLNRRRRKNKMEIKEMQEKKKVKLGYSVSADKLEEILGLYYKIKNVHMYSIDVGVDRRNAERIDLNSDDRYLVLSFREEEKEDE